MNDINGAGDGRGATSEDLASEIGHEKSRGSALGILQSRRKEGQARASPAAPAAERLRHTCQQLYNRYVAQLILGRRSLPPSKEGRRIPLRFGDGEAHGDDHDKPLTDERRGGPYISNAIRTSRYNMIDFFPKQLFFQFSRLGNFYFLCIGVPQMIPGLSTTGNYTTILPLLFFVLLTIVKEGYDDYKRHRLDKVENATIATVLRRADDRADTSHSLLRKLALHIPWIRARLSKEVEDHDPKDPVVGGFQWKKRKWSSLRVGDVIRLSRDENVPTDIVLLHADGENGLAYIETMALDGETNLKSKQVSAALKDCNTTEGILSCRAEFVVEDPNPDLYRFDGRVTVGDETLPLTSNEVVYRGSTVRNTNCAIGVVINTGEECKIRMNANQHPNAKRPALESVYNRIVVSLVFYVIILTAGCSVGYLIWKNKTEKYAWYLNGDSVSAAEIIVGFAIQFNNVIPLSLYVTLEMIKIGQMLNLNGDVEMYDEASDTPARCNTNTILENLGQIGYIFSDKTGTLTENVMKFRKMSIAGTSWLHEMDISTGEDEGAERPTYAPEMAGKKATKTRISIEEAGRVTEKGHEVTFSPASPQMLPRTPSMARRSSSHWRSTGRPDLAQPELTTYDLLEYIQRRPYSPFARKAIQYILALALCHTCLPEVKDGEIQFQASSPDELALVKAAQEMGFLVIQRSAQQTTLRISIGEGTMETRTYEILDVIEFSSKRKRMTIIVRCPDGRIWLISKGADSMILPRLKLANLAIQKANEVRKSAELERVMQRKSEQLEPRNSFGGRPSLNIRRSLALARQTNPTVSGSSSSRPPMADRTKSETGKMRRSVDILRQQHHTISARAASFDEPSPSRQLHHNLFSPSHMPEKFSFLDDPSVNDDAAIFTRCFKHLDDFATEGLRTLLYAHKFIPELEYLAWKKVYRDATTSLVDRQEAIEAAGDLIEQNLDLVGASAIEDKLQKGVPETIDKLRRANIKIWMLTGDKRETAINIAHSARICRPSSEIFILDAANGDLETQLVDIIEDMRLAQSDPNLASHSVLVVDGHTLGMIEGPTPDGSEPDPRIRQLFRGLIPSVDSVICCRASPAQKAAIIRVIRKANPSPTDPLTLAIGDGANDLAMLAEAHVGVGISGREGLQAARVADYAVAQFRFLQRLLLVHGRWNYVRTARFVLFTFWKEMFFYVPTEIFSRYTGSTGTSLYEMWSLTVLNVLFTSLCVILMGVWEQDLRAETLLAVPELYVMGQRGGALNMPQYAGWMLAAGAEGVMVFFGCWAGYGVFSQFSDNGLFALGDLVFSAAMMWTNLKLMILETHYKSSVILGGFFITVAGWWLWQFTLAGLYAPSPSPYAVRHAFWTTFGADLAWWATLGVVLAALVVLLVMFKTVKRTLVIHGLWRWRWGWLWGNGGRGAGGLRGRKGAGFEGNLEEWDVTLWQELEKDPAVREKLRLMANDEMEDNEEEEPEELQGIAEREA
ncbi:Phospholipid-transporting ATPase [Pleurostoma richardsiae]|uniref:Phospholipid-transporting ATPase n=1 Tax=Pleurostoma richardsiae TaxID=41990 RepID=A0AA38VGA4_9PEZI|nr:Phospholipid-transporting ATPase [Pleurostoma richardsiae]